MTKEKKYLVEAKCIGNEEHTGERWIDEAELYKIKSQTGNAVPEACSSCKLTIKDEEGNVLFTKEGC